MNELIADYGLTVIGLVFMGLGIVATKFLYGKDKDSKRNGYIRNALIETEAAVEEVFQVYVREAKKGRADGSWTEEEKALAKAKALDIAKSNIGTKGLKRLAKVFDVEHWIGNKIEAFVGEKKRLGELAAQG